MNPIQALHAEFTHEMSTTRSLLAILPENDLGWKPHEKSMTLGRLAVHLTEIPMWAEVTLTKSFIDLAAHKQESGPSTKAEILEAFDKHVRAAGPMIEQTSEQALMEPWSLMNAGMTIFTMPKGAVIRTWVMNHLIHHRGQLSVYLRLRNVPLPAIYGPTADATM